MAQNAFCENQFDHFASERRAERRNAVLPSREPLHYSESSLRRRCLTTSTVSTCALDRAAGEAMLQTRAQSAVLVGLKRFTTLLVRPGAFAAAGRASWASSHSCKFLGRRPLAGSRPGNEPIPTDVRVRSPAAIVPAHRSTWGVIRGVLMACLQVCRSPCLIQTARPCHDHVLTVCVCSQVALAGDELPCCCSRSTARPRSLCSSAATVRRARWVWVAIAGRRAHARAQPRTLAHRALRTVAALQHSERGRAVEREQQHGSSSPARATCEHTHTVST